MINGRRALTALTVEGVKLLSSHLCRCPFDTRENWFRILPEMFQTYNGSLLMMPRPYSSLVRQCIGDDANSQLQLEILLVKAHCQNYRQEMLEGPRPLHGFFREVWTPRHTDHSGASTWAPRYRHEDDCSYCYRSLLLFSTEGCWTSRVCSGNASGYLAIHIAVDCILVQQNHCVDPTYKTFCRLADT